ncbi:beta-1,3-galactosyltransferase 1-like [Lingula anatina]|uniref:Hexosyltransferase n=1 Tax=Lingula anatina TaxID=7574 RepID=A0A1S3HNV5_LINAN|nr:beta-1,3-galactosyltransferase 1-like [Lingula anatina]|eukprot:XP_013387733.1 beta-1,3-galactosyltransferase 1-like [Lingula anatina]
MRYITDGPTPNHTALDTHCKVPLDVCSAKMAPEYWYHLKKYRYVVNQECTAADDPYLLVLVISNPQDVKTRAAYRKTCGSWKQYLGRRIKTIFFLGKTGYKTVDEDAVAEGLHYKDTVIIDFVDSYKNYTLKTLLAFRWAVELCGNAKFVLRNGHDVTTNIQEIMDYLTSLPKDSQSSLLEGYILSDKHAPQRDPKNKYYQSPEQYPWSNFPDFVSGFATLFSFDVVRVINSASLTQHLFIEDVYMGHIAHANGIKLKHNVNFWFSPATHYRNILRSKCRFMRSFAVHRAPTSVLWAVLNGTLTKEEACNVPPRVKGPSSCHIATMVKVRELTNEERNEIVSQREEGINVTQIAARYGVSRKTVYRFAEGLWTQVMPISYTEVAA